MRLAVLLWLCLLLSCARHGAATPREDGAREHPADQIAGARLLPAESLAFVVTEDLGALVELLGRRELRERFAGQWEEVSYQLVEEAGWDLTSPELLEEVGVDVHGEAGVALLRSNSLVVFFSLSKPALFKNELYRALRGRERYAPEVVGKSKRIVVGGGGAAAVLARDTALLVFGSDAREDALAIAALDTSESLAQQRAFRVAMRGVESAPLRGYADVRALSYFLGGVAPIIGGRDAAEVVATIEKHEQRALALARARGAEVEEIVAIDERFAQMRSAVSKEEPPLRALFGGVEGAGFTLSVQPDGLDLSLSIEAAVDTPWRQALADSDAAQRFAALLDRPVLGMLSLSLKSDALVSILRRAGVDERGLQEELGVDLGRDLEALFAGDLSLALLLPEEGLMAVATTDDVTLVGRAALRDAKAGKALLKRLGESESLRRYATLDAGDLVVTPSRMGSFRVGVRGNQLLVGPDVAALGRLAKGAASGSNNSGLPESDAGRLVARNGSAASAFVHLALFVLPELGLPASKSARPAAPPWHDPAVAKSDEYQKKLAELARVDAALADLTGAAERARYWRVAAALDAVGGLALTLRQSEHGVHLDASYRTAGRTIAHAASDLVEALRTSDDRDAIASEKLDALFKERAELEAQLEEIYARDAKQPAPP